MTRFAFTAEVPEAAQPPQEIEVLYTGKFNHPAHGDFEITERDLDDLIANAGKGIDAQIDVDHSASKGNSRAAGWIKGLRRDGQRLYASVDWTPYGTDLVGKREYRYISAEYGNVRDDTTGTFKPVKRLKAASLTNRPFLKSLKPLTLSDGEHELLLDAMPHCSAHDNYDASCPDCVAEAADESAAAMDAQDLANARYMLAVGSIGGTKLGSLPKSSYAWVDSSGVGHLPYKNADGKVDAAHTRNALARLNQVKGLSGSTADSVRRKLEAALRSVGGNPGSDHQNGDDVADQIRSALKLSDDASDDDVVAAISKLSEPGDGEVTLAQFETVKTALDAAVTRLTATEKKHDDLLRDTYLAEQRREGKIDPAEMDDLVALFDVAPDKVKAMVERRKPSVLLSTVGHGDTGANQIDDPMKTGANVHRLGLDEKARELMAADKTLDYGEALIRAEKEGSA